MDLHGKSAILTGASRGLGVNIAEHMARNGTDLALAARSAEGLDKTAERIRKLGVRVVTVPTDVTRKADLKNLVKKAEAELGGIDILINNAGIESVSHFHKQAPSEIEAVIKTNVTAVELLTRLVVPQMVQRRSGHIVNVSSLAGKTGVAYNTVYASSKAAVVGFSWSLREELRPFDVGVSVVCPTFVSDEGMFADWSAGLEPPRLATIVTPEDVARAIVKSIEKNKAEILVTKGLSKLTDVVSAIAPDATGRVARAGGVTEFLRRQADRSTPD